MEVCPSPGAGPCPGGPLSKVWRTYNTVKHEIFVPVKFCLFSILVFLQEEILADFGHGKVSLVEGNKFAG